MPSLPAVCVTVVLDQRWYKMSKNGVLWNPTLSGIVLKKKKKNVSHWHSFKLVQKVFIWGVGGKADAGGGWSNKKRSVFGERNTAKNEQVLTDGAETN